MDELLSWDIVQYYCLGNGCPLPGLLSGGLREFIEQSRGSENRCHRPFLPLDEIQHPADLTWISMAFEPSHRGFPWASGSGASQTFTPPRIDQLNDKGIRWPMSVGRHDILSVRLSDYAEGIAAHVTLSVVLAPPKPGTETTALAWALSYSIAAESVLHDDGHLEKHAPLLQPFGGLRVGKSALLVLVHPRAPDPLHDDQYARGVERLRTRHLEQLRKAAPEARFQTLGKNYRRFRFPRWAGFSLRRFIALR